MAATVGKGIVEPGVVDHHVVFGALIGAIAWNVITWWYGIPSSSSHALIGGIVGAVIAKAGAGALIGRRRAEDGGLHLRLAAAGLRARLAADGAGGVDLSGARRRCAWTTGSAACSWCRPGLYSLGHGGNDAQKTIGIIWMLLIATGYAGRQRRDAAGLGDLELLHRDRPGHACSAAGASSRPWASSITKLKPVGGFCAETGGAITLFLATGAGRAGVDHAHHHRRHRRRGLGAPRLGGALGRGRQHRLGLDLHDPGVGLRSPRVVLLASACCCSEAPGARRFELPLEEALAAEGDGAPSARAAPTSSAEDHAEHRRPSRVGAPAPPGL